jgi:excisionase family DNA binding protein
MEHNYLIMLSPDELDERIESSMNRVLSKINIKSEVKQPSRSDEVVYLSRKETAARLKISLPTLWNLTRKGQIKAHRVGRRVLYRIEHVDAVVKVMNFNVEQL